MTRDNEQISYEEIRRAVRGMERELAKGEGGPYGVRYDSDLATLLATTKLWLKERGESEAHRRAIDIFERRMGFAYTEDYEQSREWSDALIEAGSDQ